MPVTWEAYGSRHTLKPEALADRDALADAARDGNWPAALTSIRANANLANATRVGGTTGYAPLHQAAWHGAPEAIAEQLIAAGAWRTLRTVGGDVTGETPHDIAQRRGHRHLAPLLQPRPAHHVPLETLALLREGLHGVIREQRPVQKLVVEHRLRLPEVEPLTELSDPQLWFPVPGYYGGFAIKLLMPEHSGSSHPELEVESWCRIVGGSGLRHRVRIDGAELVEEGFV